MFEDLIITLGGLWFVGIGAYILYLILFRQTRLRRKTIIRIKQFMNGQFHP